jgi:hypothetical protein
MMKIWRMEPQDLDNIQWQVSKFQGEVIIRAESEESARDALGYCFWKSGQSGNANMAGPPWNRPNLVIASEYEGVEYSPQGEEEILSPPEAIVYWLEFKS